MHGFAQKIIRALCLNFEHHNKWDECTVFNQLYLIRKLIRLDKIRQNTCSYHYTINQQNPCIDFIVDRQSRESSTIAIILMAMVNRLVVSCHSPDPLWYVTPFVIADSIVVVVALWDGSHTHYIIQKSSVYYFSKRILFYLIAIWCYKN